MRLSPSGLTIKALKHISVESYPVNKIEMIEISQIYYEIWMPSRIERCRETYRESKTLPPPPKLVGFCLSGPDDGHSTTIYEPANGHHRCAFAEELGMKTLPAMVLEINRCAPEKFEILVFPEYRELRGSNWWIEFAHDDSLGVELQRLGVPVRVRSVTGI